MCASQQAQAFSKTTTVKTSFFISSSQTESHKNNMISPVNTRFVLALGFSLAVASSCVFASQNEENEGRLTRVMEVKHKENNNDIVDSRLLFKQVSRQSP